MAKFTIDEKEIDSGDETMPLLWYIRDVVGKHGTHFGCGQGLCGACSVILNGVSVRSCQLTVDGLDGAKITTINGISESGGNAVQQAWLEEKVPQCGYCQSGQIISATALLEKNPNPSDEDIDAAMSGNICRCGTYPRIKKAIKRAAQDGKK